MKEEYYSLGIGSNYIFEFRPSTSLELELNPFVQDFNFSSVIVSRGYASNLTETTDIFYIFKDHVLDLLRSRKCFLIIDNSVEGHSDLEFPIILAIYYSCQKYNIDPDLIFLFDGNLRAETINSVYVKLLKLSKSINIICINGCENFVIKNAKINYWTMRSKCEQSNSDKLLLSLSRRPRYYRSLAQYLIATSPLKDKSILSQDSVHSNFVKYTHKDDYENEVNYSLLDEWVSTLPYKADNTDFMYNYAGDLNLELYEKTIFSLVLETHQHSAGDTSFFYSEKCFKPMLCFQPFIIYGQYGCNYGLKEFGYKTYEKYFNIDKFDYETNPVKRLLLIKEELDTVSNNLMKMSRAEQLNWRFRHLDILLYNQNHYFKKSYFSKKIKEAVSTMKSITEGTNKFYWCKI